MGTATDYVNAVLAAHPTVVKLHVPVTQIDQLELHELPSSVRLYTWPLDFSQGNDDTGAIVVVFRF